MNTAAQQGVTLLEVLIALLVLSIGLLGLAALQTRAVRFSQVADMQQRAVQLARNISEHMQASPAAVRRGDYVQARGQPVAVASGPAPAALQSWQRQLAALPAGTGEIVPCTASTPVSCTDIDGHIITVYWNAARDPATRSYNCPPKSSADYRCYRQIIQ
jgi:type IV pilus assembly protein PilV